MTPEIRREIEKAYRRGFHQGAYIALQQLGEGYSYPDLKSWLQEVYRWRCGLPSTPTPPQDAYWPCPPELPIQKNGGAK